MHLCIRSVRRAEANNDTELMNAVVSVRSALIPHLNKLHANLPAELRPHYDVVLRKGG